MPWSVAAFLLALFASLVLLLAPLTTHGEGTSVPAPGSSVRPETSVSKVTHPSLLETGGWSVAVPLSVPVILAGLGMLASWLGARGALTGIAVLLGAFVVLGALSVGVYYVPAEAALITAAVKGRRP